MFLFCFFSCAFSQDYGDAIVSASISDARTLVPILASDSASAEICAMVFNGLIKYDKNLNLAPDLAESWSVEEGGLVILFKLRKGVLWHDGSPFTAKDVEFTYQKLIDPQVKTPYSGDFERVKSLEVIDDYTIKVTYKEPFSPGLSSWGMPIMPKHLLIKEDLNRTEFSRKPIGTGPYKFKSWVSQEKIELTANPDYFEKRPYIDRCLYRIIPDEATIFLELQSQGIDSGGLTPLQFSRQTDSAFFKKNFRKFRLPSFGYTYLGYNLKNPKFQDKRVRQALNLAVDKNEIIKMILLGYGKPVTGPFIPGSWAFDESIKPSEFNPSLAKKLLVEAGFKDKSLEFTITTNQGNEERIKTAQIIQRRLGEIGVKVKIKVLEWSVFVSECLEKKNFEAVILAWGLGRDPDNFDIWHSSKIKEGEFNFISYKNEEVDRLLIEGRKIFDQEKRKSCYQQIHRILYDEQPYMFLYIADSLFALHNRFQGIEPAPIGISHNFIYWWVPKGLQKYNRIEN